MPWGDTPSGDDRIEVYPTLDEARAKFGENWGGYVFELTPAQAQALLRGEVVAFDISGREYAGFMRVKPAPAQSPSGDAP